MKKVFITALASLGLILPVVTYAQLGWQWAAGPTCHGGNESEGWIIKMDPSNNAIIAGVSMVYDSFCIGTNTFHLSGVSLFVARYSNDGALRWAKGCSHGMAEPMDVATDAAGNVYVAGYFFSDTFVFNSHMFIKANAADGNNLFIAKLNSSGNVIWTKTGSEIIGYSTWNPRGALAVDAQNNLYMTGTFGGPYGPWTGMTYPPVNAFYLGADTVHNTDPTANSMDIFLTRIDPSGNVIWIKDFGSTSDDYHSSIVISKDNKIYLSGQCDANFHLGSSVTLTNPGIFLAELDTAGNAIWARGSSGAGTLNCSAVGADGNVYIGGLIYGDSVRFGAHATYAYPYPSMSEGGFIFKFNSSGSCIWGKGFATPDSNSYSEIHSLVVDPCGNLWATGGFFTSVAVDSTHTLNDTAITTNPDPFFVVEYDTTGTLLDRFQLPTGGDDASGICSDAYSDIFFAGDYEADPFILGTDTFHLGTVADEEDFFVAKYKSVNYYHSCADSLISPLSIASTPQTAVALFPNPATTSLTISSPEKITSISITNLLGQTVYTHEYNSEKVEVDVSRLRTGVYFVKVNGSEVKKFVKS